PIVELFGEQRDRIGAGLAEAALPHLQLESNVVLVLSAEIWDRRRLPRTVRTMAVSAAGDPFLLAANRSEVLTLVEEPARGSRQRQERRIDAGIVGCHVGDIVFRQS